MYLTPTKRHWIVDIEGDDLRDNVSVVWVVCIENAITDEKFVLTDYEEIRQWFLDHAKDYFVGHNFISFDGPILNKLVGTRIGIGHMVDTMVLSMLYSPKFAGGHSLEVWGQRLRFPKLAHKDFTKLSDEMIVYCQQDVAVTKKVFSSLTQRMREVGFTETGAEIEHKHWHVIQNKQRRRGFPFDKRKAELLYAELRQRESELKDVILKLWPPVLSVVGRYKKAFKANGEHSAGFVRHAEQFPKLELHDDGSYSAYDWVEFNLGSPTQRVAKLLEIGWTPTSYTKVTPKGGGGNPKVDEESLLKFAEESDNKEVTALAKWIVINSRANNVNTWLNAYNEKTGAIHGNIWLASTLRYRHDKPNSANIPAVRIKENKETKEKKILYGEDGGWTYEARDCWTCGDDDRYILVGIDGKGIQLRILAHYLNEPNFSAAILSEDPHEANKQNWGLESRALTKTITYATLMGAGDNRIATEAHVTIKEAKAGKAKFFEAVPGLPKLINRLKTELKKKGRISLCDGTPVLVPSDHMVIPYLLQGDESRLMRKAYLYLDEEIRRNKWDAVKVGDIHDEWQMIVLKEHFDAFIVAALDSFVKAGQFFKYNVPIEGDFKPGRTWAETH